MAGQRLHGPRVPRQLATRCGLGARGCPPGQVCARADPVQQPGMLPRTFPGSPGRQRSCRPRPLPTPRMTLRRSPSDSAPGVEAGRRFHGPRAPHELPAHRGIGARVRLPGRDHAGAGPAQQPGRFGRERGEYQGHGLHHSRQFRGPSGSRSRWSRSCAAARQGHGLHHSRQCQGQPVRATGVITVGSFKVLPGRDHAGAGPAQQPGRFGRERGEYQGHGLHHSRLFQGPSGSRSRWSRSCATARQGHGLHHSRQFQGPSGPRSYWSRSRTAARELRQRAWRSSGPRASSQSAVSRSLRTVLRGQRATGPADPWGPRARR